MLALGQSDPVPNLSTEFELTISSEGQKSPNGLLVRSAMTVGSECKRTFQQHCANEQTESPLNKLLDNEIAVLDPRFRIGVSSQNCYCRYDKVAISETRDLTIGVKTALIDGWHFSEQ